MIPNHYKTLRLDRTATKEEIKKAYKRLALEFHPDRNGSPDAHEKFIEINEAYLILYDLEARAKYDREYDKYYGEKRKETSNAKSERKSPEKEYDRQNAYEDEDLNKWSKNAREQAESFAKMAFKDFANLVAGMVKETGFQLGNGFLVMIGAFLTFGGCGNLIVGLSTNGDMGNPVLGIILLPLGIFLYMFAQKNFENHKN